MARCILFCDAMKPLVNSHLILWSATTNTLQSAICLLTILSQFQICSRMQSASFSSGVSSGSCGDMSTTESPRWLRSTTNQLGSSPDNWGSPHWINSPVESSNWPKSGNMMQRPQSTPTDLSRRSWDGEEYVLPPIDLLRLD